MNPRSQAVDAVNWYFAHYDPDQPNPENVRQHLRGPLLAVTFNALVHSAPMDPAGAARLSESNGTSNHSKINEDDEEEKKSSSGGFGGDWRDYLQVGGDNNTGGMPNTPTSLSSSASSHFSPLNEKGQEAYDALSRRTKARMEAFLVGCTLAVPSDAIAASAAAGSGRPSINDAGSRTSKENLSLQEGLSGFGISEPRQKKLSMTDQQLLQQQRRKSSFMRQLSISSSVKYPQISREDLITRLELHIRTMQRVKNLGEECVIAMEPPKSIKARARTITQAFVATAGCVRAMKTVLTRILHCATMEILAVEALSEEKLTKVVRRIVSEYEHGTSFASLAFLSTPEVNADSLLMPLIVKYLKYLQSDWENLVKACELERMLQQCLDPNMRKLFKTIEFQSIGHLLEVFHEHRSKLHNIELAPNVCAVAENINQLCESKDALRQALRDLQREVITVNGHVLPPVTSRKDLLQLLTQTLNSRTLTAAKPKPKHRSPHKHHRYKRYASSPAKLNEMENGGSEHQPGQRDLAENFDSDALLSDDPMSEAQDSSECESPKKKSENSNGKKQKRRNFHLSTIDLLTRRLLIAASRTGNGGDAYFILRDLFGGEDVEVVPTNNVGIQGRMVRPGTIDILVRLANVTIKCHQSFDVYPKDLVGECEPLIQFHTTTTETIDLREVRSADSDEDGFVYDKATESGDENDEEKVDGKSTSLLVVQEQKTSRTGWRTISIRPALYEKVEVWNTPS